MEHPLGPMYAPNITLIFPSTIYESSFLLNDLEWRLSLQHETRQQIRKEHIYVR